MLRSVAARQANALSLLLRHRKAGNAASTRSPCLFSQARLCGGRHAVHPEHGALGRRGGQQRAVMVPCERHLRAAQAVGARMTGCVRVGLGLRAQQRAAMRGTGRGRMHGGVLLPCRPAAVRLLLARRHLPSPMRGSPSCRQQAMQRRWPAWGEQAAGARCARQVACAASSHTHWQAPGNHGVSRSTGHGLQN
jgi:hypothetical protein